VADKAVRVTYCRENRSGQKRSYSPAVIPLPRIYPESTNIYVDGTTSTKHSTCPHLKGWDPVGGPSSDIRPRKGIYDEGDGRMRGLFVLCV
jgi:hypothetical protein